MISNNTPLVGLVSLVIVIAVIAALGALGISRSDILRPNTSAAEARAKDQETKLKDQKAAIDMKSYEAIQAARAQAEQEKIRLEVDARQRELEQSLTLQRERAAQDMELVRLTRYALSLAGALAVLIASVGLTVGMIRLSLSRWVPARPQVVYADPWDNHAWKAEQICHAQEVEMAERRSALVWRAARRPTVNGNGRHPPESRPVEATGLKTARVHARLATQQ